MKFLAHLTRVLVSGWIGLVLGYPIAFTTTLIFGAPGDVPNGAHIPRPLIYFQEDLAAYGMTIIPLLCMLVGVALAYRSITQAARREHEQELQAHSVTVEAPDNDAGYQVVEQPTVVAQTQQKKALSVRIVEMMLCVGLGVGVHLLLSLTVFQYAILIHRDLSGTNWVKANLNYQNLQYWNLSNVDFGMANLRGANLQGVTLSAADLVAADLRRADLSHADLRGTNLTMADLYLADLEGANLQGADLTHARLDEAKLYGADFRAAKLAGVSLKDCQYDAATKWPAGFSLLHRGAVKTGLHIEEPEPTPQYWYFPKNLHR